VNDLVVEGHGRDQSSDNIHDQSQDRVPSDLDSGVDIMFDWRFDVLQDMPDIAQSDIAQSDIAQSDIAQSDIAQSDIAQSDIAQSDIAQSDIERGCSGAQISALTPSPRPVGGLIRFNLSAMCTRTPEFMVFESSPIGVWTMLAGYSQVTHFDWDTSAKSPGIYTLVVWGRRVGSTERLETAVSVNYELLP
jgi:hypothetical protein